MTPPLRVDQFTGDERPYVEARRAIDAKSDAALYATTVTAAEARRKRPRDPLTLFRAAYSARLLAWRTGTIKPIPPEAWRGVRDPGTLEFMRLRTVYGNTAAPWNSLAGQREFFGALDALILRLPKDDDLLWIGAKYHGIFRMGNQARGVTYARRYLALRRNPDAEPRGYYALGWALVWVDEPKTPPAIRVARLREAIPLLERFQLLAPPYQKLSLADVPGMLVDSRKKLADALSRLPKEKATSG